MQISDYLLRNSSHPNVISELINVIFSLLKLTVPEDELERFIVLREMIEKICEMMGDKLVQEDIK